MPRLLRERRHRAVPQRWSLPAETARSPRSPTVCWDPHVKRALGRSAYAVQTLRELPVYRYKRIHICLDGQETQAFSVIVSEGRLYGGSFMLAPIASPVEPGFSVVLFDHAGIRAPLLHGAALPLGLLRRAPGVRHVRARMVDFVGNDVIPLVGRRSALPMHLRQFQS